MLVLLGLLMLVPALISVLRYKRFKGYELPTQKRGSVAFDLISLGILPCY